MTELVTEFSADIEVRKEDNGTRTIKGLAVPWGEVTNVAGGKEMFARGAIKGFTTVPLFYGHSHQAGGYPIGTVTRGEDTEEGFAIEATIFDTPNANEAYAGLKGGALKAFSVGFQSLEHNRDDDEVTVRTSVNLREVSVVPFPAYAGALISEVRSEQEKKEVTMTENNFASVADVAELRSSNEALQRQLQVIESRSSSAPEPITYKFTSMGDFVKRGLAEKQASQDDIDLLIRAYADTGEVVANASSAFVPSWLARDIKVLAQRRKVLEFFSKEALPSEGMTVTYPKFGSSTGTVGKQALEGDNLNLIKVLFSSDSALVGTYGAYSDISRQFIERTPTTFLNKVLEVQKAEYAKTTNGAVRTLLQDTPTAYNQLTIATGVAQTTAAPWINAAGDGTQMIRDNSQALEAGLWMVSTAIFNKIRAVYDTTGRSLFVVNGDGTNSIGNLNVLGQSANIAGLPVVVDSGLAATESYICSAEALTVLEDGAKYLRDENIVNLTAQFSIYGYLALTKNDVKGITRVTVAA